MLQTTNELRRQREKSGDNSSACWERAPLKSQRWNTIRRVLNLKRLRMRSPGATVCSAQTLIGRNENLPGEPLLES